MHVAISGTHGSGKSTLLSDFTMSHRGWAMLPDPFEYLDGAEQNPGASVFFQQLQIAADRLSEPMTKPVIAERCPLDFLAYLHALDVLGRSGASAGLFERGYELTTQAMTNVDLLILLPLSGTDSIDIGADEVLELRDAMNESLLELVDELDLAERRPVVEVTGNRAQRLARLEGAIRDLGQGLTNLV
ncbi:AAA family ATPase [Leucobacter viscericola]|uniref:AAA family ATPase n=1 Tax=Leucobacter viscericola TaxID=2714935 RepID=A0A6G7XCL5_9MICO|nr:AAA family ATPase [Leucobacter viscericola]